MFDVGDTVGEYRIVSRLNQGGMATLFLGHRVGAPEGAEPVAIKAIHEALSEDWQFVRMFIDEAMISIRLRHPNVVRVDELGEQDNSYFLAMEYVHGCSLSDLLRTMGRAGRRMRPEIAVWIAAQVAAGLHAAHEMTGHDGQLLGVVHRDVSPQNVLLAVDGQVKLLDFGIAKAAGRADRTAAGVIKGKVRYMAPEQATGAGVDRRVDVYALGVVLWEMLTMRRYIEGKNELEIIRKVQRPEQVPPSFRVEGIDPAIDDAVMAALSPAIERRPPSADALKRLLEGAVPAESIGPAHVAELLRVFMGAALEKAAEGLPPAVAGPIVKMAREPTPLPGDRDVVDDDARARTLTHMLPSPLPDEDAREEEASDGRASAADFEATRGAMPAPSGDAEERRATVRDLPRDQEEETLEASGGEVADFLQRIRLDPAPLIPSNPSPSVPAARLEPDPTPAPPAAPFAAPPPDGPTQRAEPLARGNGSGWWIRLVAMTVVAVVLGAGLALAAIRLLR